MKLLIFPKKIVARTALVLCLALAAVAYARVTDGQSVAAWTPSKKPLPIYRVARDDKTIAVSFDAAWGDEKTEGILEILAARDIKTTFFLVSYWIDAYPDKVRMIADAGHEIGNHSNTHPHFTKLSADGVREELRVCADKLEAITGKRPNLFRCPYGDYNDMVINTANAEGYQTIQWDIDSLDWKSQGSQAMIKRVTSNVQAGSIVLFHNNSDDILEALPVILDQMIASGYTIVPISELLLSGDTYIDQAGCQRPVEEGER